MNTKVFLLGRPGSGKSTIARYLELAVTRNCEVHRINDYDHLYRMFLRDQNVAPREKQFLPVGRKEDPGFDVLDFSVLDTVLLRMEKVIERMEFKFNLARVKKLYVLEFARNDYTHALEQFSPDFLRDAHFFYLDAGKKICRDRVHERNTHPMTEDDHFVSDEIMNTYYRVDDCSHWSTTCLTSHGMELSIVRIDNTGSLEKLYEAVEKTVIPILRREREQHKVQPRSTKPLALSG